MSTTAEKLTVIEGCKPEQIPDKVFSSTQPLLLRGLARSWPAVEAALKSPLSIAEYIKRFDRGEPVTVYEVPASENGRVFYNEDLSGFNFNRSRKTISGVIEKLFSSHAERSNPTLYIGSTMVDHWLPGFREHNDLNLEGRESLVSIWLGNQSRIAAHYDFPNNLACSLAGKRRFTLFPPEQADNLYVGPIDFAPSGQAISLVDFSDPDFVAHPNFKEALKASLVVELEPGDVLFIPSMWWHHVESLESFNVLVNYWWRTTPVSHGSPNNALLHAMLAIRDLTPTQKKVWRDIFDSYVFSEGDAQFAHIPESARGVLNGIDEEMAARLRAQLVKFLK